MTECNYYEVPCTRSVQGVNFSQGVQDYTFSIGAPNCWIPSKSFFRVDMSIYQFTNPQTALPLLPSQLCAFADNAVGNLYDNAYMRAGQQDISSVVQYAAQASALDVRLNNTLPWLQSMGSATAVNEASFMKRVQEVSANPGYVIGTGPQLTRMNAYEKREMFRPASLANYAAATVAIGANNVITGINTLFLTGMPSVTINGIPSNSGGSVLPGDILVVNGVEYELDNNFALPWTATAITITSALVTAVAATADWFIVRADAIRSKQAASTVYALWQPPIGIFKYDEELGAGDYRIQLNPNANFRFNAVETRNTNFAAGLPYFLVINDVRLYTYVEKRMIPDAVRDLHLTEMLVQSKTFANNLQFSVPPSTTEITIFFQDSTSGSSPLIPPSMFKILDNSDLSLKNIQITYANITKPSTNWDSSYAVAHTATPAAGPILNFDTSGVNRLEQRYHDSYEESGLDIKSCAQETFYDWLQRGPFYHFSFERDVNNKSTEVQLNLVFNPNGKPPDATRVFIAAQYRKTVQITTSKGLVVNVAAREV